MEIKLNPRKDFPGRGPCIQMIGDWVTEDVWKVVSRLMNDNWMTSPVYKARQKSHAYFQSGSHDPRGKWILLEFWSKEEDCADFIKILNEEINKVINPTFTKICLVANSNNQKDIDDLMVIAQLIADDTGCKMITGAEAENNRCRVMFAPENSVQHGEVHISVEHVFQLKHSRWLDKWQEPGFKEED